MRRIPVVQLRHRGNSRTGRRDGGQKHRHENRLAVRNPSRCVDDTEKLDKRDVPYDIDGGDRIMVADCYAIQVIGVFELFDIDYEEV